MTIGGIGSSAGTPGIKRAKSLQDQIRDLINAGASADQIMASLKEAGAGAEAVAKAMKEAGCSANLIIAVLQELKVPLPAVTATLKKIGFSCEETAKALSQVLIMDPAPPRWLRPEEIGKLLKGAGYEPKEVAKGLAAIGCREDKVADILVDLKVHPDEIRKAMKKAGFSEAAILKALIRATGRAVDSWPVGKYSLRERAGL